MKKLSFFFLFLFIFMVLFCGFFYLFNNNFLYEQEKSDKNYVFIIPHNILSFESAKSKARKIFADHQVTFYCGCDYKNEKSIDTSKCGYIPKNGDNTQTMVQYEHIVPASTLGNNLSCWNEKICTDSKGKSFKGRKCCSKIDTQFRVATSDLYNIVPAINKININRSDFMYGELEGEKRVYGACDFEVDSKLKLAEPREEIRGWIARAELYMDDTYTIYNLSQEQKIYFEKWDKMYPPTAWEITWANRVKEIQGNVNTYIVRWKKPLIYERLKFF